MGVDDILMGHGKCYYLFMGLRKILGPFSGVIEIFSKMDFIAQNDGKVFSI